MAKSKQLTPLPGYVLIEPIDEQETSSSGLVLPEKAKEKPGKGKIVGKGSYMESKDYNLVLWDAVRVGQLVIFHRWAGQDVKEGTKEYRLVKYVDLMGAYV